MSVDSFKASSALKIAYPTAKKIFGILNKQPFSPKYNPGNFLYFPEKLCSHLELS
jgi:hypothetical protein